MLLDMCIFFSLEVFHNTNSLDCIFQFCLFITISDAYNCWITRILLELTRSVEQPKRMFCSYQYLVITFKKQFHLMQCTHTWDGMCSYVCDVMCYGCKSSGFVFKHPEFSSMNTEINSCPGDQGVHL